MAAQVPTSDEIRALLDQAVAPLRAELAALRAPSRTPIASGRGSARAERRVDDPSLVSPSDDRLGPALRLGPGASLAVELDLSRAVLELVARRLGPVSD